MKKEKWEELQEKSLEKYMRTKNPVGIFSYNGMKSAKKLGEIMNELIPNQTCLDVGCGLLPIPYYMEVADKIVWFGIDPYDDDFERGFDFTPAKAEDIPFDDNEFDNILLATSLDHFYKPDVAIEEIYRVLNDGGLVFVWTALLGEAGDAHHPLGYSDESIKKLFNKFEFVELMTVNVAEYLYIFRK